MIALLCGALLLFVGSAFAPTPRDNVFTSISVVSVPLWRVLSLAGVTSWCGAGLLIRGELERRRRSPLTAPAQITYSVYRDSWRGPSWGSHAGGAAHLLSDKALTSAPDPSRCAMARPGPALPMRCLCSRAPSRSYAHTIAPEAEHLPLGAILRPQRRSGLRTFRCARGVDRGQ